MESSRVVEDAVAKETAVVEDEAAVGKAPGMKFEAIAHSSLSQNLSPVATKKKPAVASGGRLVNKGVRYFAKTEMEMEIQERQGG